MEGGRENIVVDSWKIHINGQRCKMVTILLNMPAVIHILRSATFPSLCSQLLSLFPAQTGRCQSDGEHHPDQHAPDTTDRWTDRVSYLRAHFRYRREREGVLVSSCLLLQGFYTCLRLVKEI